MTSAATVKHTHSQFHRDSSGSKCEQSHFVREGLTPPSFVLKPCVILSPLSVHLVTRCFQDGFFFPAGGDDCDERRWFSLLGKDRWILQRIPSVICPSWYFSIHSFVMFWAQYELLSHLELEKWFYIAKSSLVLCEDSWMWQIVFCFLFLFSCTLLSTTAAW